MRVFWYQKFNSTNNSNCFKSTVQKKIKLGQQFKRFKSYNGQSSCFILLGGYILEACIFKYAVSYEVNFGILIIFNMT